MWGEFPQGRHEEQDIVYVRGGDLRRVGLTARDGVRVARLANGRTATVTLPHSVEIAGAQLEPFGLVYAYVQRRESTTSRILFVGSRDLERRLAKATRTLPSAP